MRIQALTLLILATLVSAVTANDQIERLLADLSFGDEMESDAGSSVAEADEPTLQSPVALEQEELAIEKTAPVSNSANFSAFTGGVAAGSGSQLPQASASTAVLEDPVPDVAPRADINPPKVDETSLPEVAWVQSVENKPVGHRKHSSACEPLSNKAGVICRPRVSPCLPTSTLLQYFRGSPCYANVWDGYRCDGVSRHARLHDECGSVQARDSVCESFDVRKRK